MRQKLALSSLFVIGLGLFSGGEARAEDPMPTSMDTGSCMGMAGMGGATLAGQTYLTVGKGSDQQFLLAGTKVVFGRAECECRSRDIGLGIRLTSALPLGSMGVAVQMWTGLDACSTQTTRTTNGQQCEQISTTSPPGNGDFALGSDLFMTVAPFSVPIPAESLINAKPVGNTSWQWSCDINGTQNSTVTVLVGPDSSPATCTLPLSVKTSLPPPPDNVSLRSGSGALSVAWTGPFPSDITYYQVLCRKHSDPNTPVKDSDYVNNTHYWFSSCVNGTLYRRPLGPPIVNNTVVPMAAGVVPPPPPDMMSDVSDMGLSDGGAADAGQSDAGTAVTTPFPIDGRFICSDRIQATSTSLSVRIDGLDDGADYDVMVVSIDTFGNPAASSVALGKPVATQNPIAPFCEANGGVCPTGFGCQAAGAPVSFGALLLLLLGGGFLIMRQRRLQKQAAMVVNGGQR